MTPRRTRQAAGLLLALALAADAALGACGSASPGTVSVLASWSGAERAAFQQVLDRFTARTGIQVDFQGTRALSQVLASDIDKGDPPDVAMLPSPGELSDYAQRRLLLPLDDVISPDQEVAYGPQWHTLARVGTEHLYGVPVKADVKSLVWYDPARLTSPPPQNLDLLMALGGGLASPWCLGMEATPTSGWPGTDWIEDILLHQAGPAVYQQWATGRLAWTDQRVRDAWLTWGRLLTGPDGARPVPRSALLTGFGDAGRSMFTDPPGCALEHQGSFIMASYQGYRGLPGGAPVPGRDFRFFRFPGLSGRPEDQPSEVSADLAGMFRDTPQARSLMRFLSTDEAQRIWPGIPGSNAFSVSRNVGGEVYRDDVSKGIATILTSAGMVCFDASDLMPAAMRNAFYRAVLGYLDDPARLDTLLDQLEKIRAGAQADSTPRAAACGG
ncbi:carbohydrate ABC transporter substrate-binding protein [Solihabitans fulvus]|uniref:Carbohydrate ABC transporter substrate-binding protein n=1 Tax=Solihabitans fulvus TaxID=1892852 RepID=A0A5B2WPK5_9PSEU|nr:ABC transporter substrate-binding protein [Solihabitans fulvus]KAA2253893.1 carbohydrate ABC transporter substrate-binding protein [Solihabitans fulvus]